MEINKLDEGLASPVPNKLKISNSLKSSVE
jgi:hypothetical protein